MTQQELESLKTVIRFLWRDEQKHFEDMLVAGDDASDQIIPAPRNAGSLLDARAGH